jgi:probable FeS assembly SUF system protein SufT
MFAPQQQSVVLHRDVEVVAVPSGEALTLDAGQLAVITQALGSAFTLMVRGNLYRLSGHDADAIGKPMPPEPALPADPTDAQVEAAVDFALRQCFDPEIPVNIVDLGLIYRCEIKPQPDGTRRVEIDMTLTAPACGMGPILVHDVRTKVERIPTVQRAAIELVFEPPWSREMMSEEALLETGLY